MERQDLMSLLLLAALWGASFLFMRVAAPLFGPPALIALRVGLAALVLLPLLLWSGEWRYFRSHAGPLALMGVLNLALPFLLIAWALLSLPAGVGSVLNATTPLMTALLAWPMAHEPLTRRRLVGLLLGLSGVVVLVAGKGGFAGDRSAGPLPVLAMLGATASYGIAAHLARRLLVGVPPRVSTCGSLMVASVLLLPLAASHWPSTPVPSTGWLAVVGLALGSTAFAYLLYYRLLARLGATRAVTVTYLVPLFGVLWGVLLLGETLRPAMLAGALLILAGVAWTQGAVPFGRLAKSPR